MVSVKEVPAEMMIKKLSDYLRKNVPELNPPNWASLVKTGVSRERLPNDPDWWYIRAASILRKIYLLQPIGVQRLASFYGGRGRRGIRPEHHISGARNNLRKILQQLEKAGLVRTTRRGRILTPKGASLLDKFAAKILKELEIKPWWEKYGGSA